MHALGAAAHPRRCCPPPLEAAGCCCCAVGRPRPQTAPVVVTALQQPITCMLTSIWHACRQCSQACDQRNGQKEAGHRTRRLRLGGAALPCFAVLLAFAAGFRAACTCLAGPLVR